ncbi:hypothetical protein PBI_DEWDROP_125 [Microbacterium phage Dewdrop]|nr:hypothetical protein PBI_LEAF_125 [Microbacterium phage Leaf]QGZ17493.1 hypothetical protein PBI_DEWDROP_125 [Microbacterium phage Dewdrop]
MGAPALVRAAVEFQRDEARRLKKPRFSEQDNAELDVDLDILVNQVEDQSNEMHALRGELAVELFGMNDTFEEKAVTVLADILHALNAQGVDPITALAHARAHYYREVPVSLAEQAFIDNPTED